MPDTFDNTPADVDPALQREAYAAQLIAEHVALGFPQEIAQIVADQTLDFADAVQEQVSEIGERFLQPLREAHPAVVSYAVLHAAARLLTARMEHIHQQSAQHILLLMSPEPDEETQH
jgi:phage gp36-like protein